MRNRLLTLLVGLLLGALVAGPVLANDDDEPDDDHGRVVETDRVFGADRIDTAVAISQYEFPGGASEVYLARADNFADAVSAGALKKGPVLLVPQCGDLPASVAAELSRLHPRRVVALGGPAAVCDDVLAQAAEAATSRGDDDCEPTEGPEDEPTEADDEPTEDATDGPSEGDEPTEGPTEADDEPTETATRTGDACGDDESDDPDEESSEDDEPEDEGSEDDEEPGDEATEDDEADDEPTEDATEER